MIVRLSETFLLELF